MSHVIGIDLSSSAVELVGLDETSSLSFWHHVDLSGPTALERLRDVPRKMPRWGTWWDDVYLVAIEAPWSHGQPGTLAKLSRVFGAVTACIPPRIEVWEVNPQAWRVELGLKANASKDAVAARAVELGAYRDWADQNAYDAFSVAWFARSENDRIINAA